jgi:DNA-binding transcriptional LysR family regulator
MIESATAGGCIPSKIGTMNDRLLALKIFVGVAQTGSFSRAGQAFGISQSSASRLIATLERNLGTKLLTRTTRSVTLTRAGQDYMARAAPALAILEEASHAVRGETELRGVLRVALPANAAIREVIPRLPVFIAQHPRLRIDLSLDDRRTDLIRDAIDVAIRFGDLGDSAATARRIDVNPRLLAASPAYLKRTGPLRSPSDLADHELILSPPGGTSDAWTFRCDGRVLSVRVDGRVIVNVTEAGVACAVAAVGIVRCSVWGCRAELLDGRLVPVLRDWKLPSVNVHALFPAGRAAKPAARAFVDFLVAALKRAPSIPSLL